jgi:hypothetical protein
MRPYVVRQGDTVAAVVAPKGADPDAVWKDPKNDSLRALRSDPAVLCPGDILYIPEDDPPSHSVTIGATNTFTASAATQTVKLVLGGAQLLANTAYLVKGLGDDIPGTTKSDGSLSVDVPIDVDTFVLEVPTEGISRCIMVGHLDPVDEDSGVRQRLSNLGYTSILRDVVEGFGVLLTYDTALFVRVFQIDNGLEPHGEADDKTRDALKSAHGT